MSKAAVILSKTGQILKKMTRVRAPVDAVSRATAKSIVADARSTQSVNALWEPLTAEAITTSAAMNHMVIASAIHSWVMTSRLSCEVSLKPLTTRAVGRM